VKRVLTVVFFCMLWSFAAAKVEVVEFSDPEDSKRYKTLIKELRCMVCQNQNIASSNADLAKDLRQQVYQRIANGETNEQIVAFMVARYGDFVLYKPPLNAKTSLLWLGPFVLLIVAVSVMIILIRKRKIQTTSDIDDEEIDRVRRLLDNNK